MIPETNTQHHDHHGVLESGTPIISRNSNKNQVTKKPIYAMAMTSAHLLS
jgi:hypothetical protein